MTETTPPDVKRFEWAALASIALSVPNVVIADLARDAGAAHRLTLNEFLFSVVLAGALALLVLSASRRRSNPARWLFIALATASFALTLWTPSLITEDGLVSGILFVAQTALDVAACFFALTPASNAWFSGKGAPQA